MTPQSHVASSPESRVHLRRITLDLSRDELAARAGLSYPHVSAIENGRKRGS